MTDDFPTPPHRFLPPDVRDRLRATLNRDLAGEQRSQLDRARGPIAIAAGVAVLAAGAMIVAQSVNGASNNQTPGHPPSPTVSRENLPLDVDKAKAKLDRCFAAVQQAGKTDKFPSRSQWVPMHQTDFQGVNVTGAVAAGKVFFCETTDTEVIISDPDAVPTPVPGSTTSALLQTRLNTFAGVVDARWPRPFVEFTGPGGPIATLPDVRSGLFVVQSGGIVAGPIRVAESDPMVTRAQWKPLPPAPAPAVSIVDRPTNPPPDRTSDRGRKVGECLKAADAALGVQDVQSWRPGAVLDVGDERLTMLRNEFGSATCWTTKGHKGFLKGVPTTSQSRPGPGGTQLDLDVGTVMSGTVPDVCVRMEVSGQAAIDVYDGTYVVFLPKGVDTNGPTKLYDANNRVIYEGRLGF